MIRGFGYNKPYNDDLETADELMPDFCDYSDYPHTIPHKNRTKNLKNVKNQENGSNKEILKDNQG